MYPIVLCDARYHVDNFTLYLLHSQHRRMLIKVKVQTGARAESVQRLAPDSYRVTVREKPIENRANDRVKLVMARYFKVDADRVRMVSGHTRGAKKLDIIDLRSS